MDTFTLERRQFLLTSTAFFAAPILARAGSGDGITLDTLQQKSLHEYLENAEKKYSPKEKMLSKKITSGFYHTQLSSGTVHETRGSFMYAVALLDSGDPKNRQRAIDILHRCIDLQDQNPASKTYGIWSWYMEEPLDKMAPPDWNWADFCSTQLLLAWMDHRHRLGAELADKVKDSIIHAARSIKKRNVGPGYTNIAIMGTNVSLLVGEQFNLPEFTTYGKQRLRTFHAYTFEQGSFTEYNSPTYTIVALTEIIRMLMYVQDRDDKKLVQELHDFAWEHAARHFHAPSGQWGGPHSRCYRSILTKTSGTRKFIEYGLGNQGILVPPEEMSLGDAYRLVYACPAKLHHYFKALPAPQSVVETFVKKSDSVDSAIVHGVKTRNEIIGTTYQHPAFSFGSVNVGDLWNQRRPFIAYWGTPEQPTSLRVRFLHDLYDYSSAQIFTEQLDHCALTHIAFATDSGDTHISIDRIRGSIHATDLRLRFEFEGTLETLQLTQSTNDIFTVQGQDREVHFMIQRIADSFDGKPFQWQRHEEDGKPVIDAILYTGKEKLFDFETMQEAYLAFAFQINDKTIPLLPMNPISHSINDGTIQTTWNKIKDNQGISLACQIKPDQKEKVQASYQARRGA
jgi:hypothetical protein